MIDVNEQTTIADDTSISGMGLHTGSQTTVTMHPAGPDVGIVFRRVDIDGTPKFLLTPDAIENENDNVRCTVLGRGDAKISTVEHLLSALHGLGVDNILIDIDGPEMPGLDGSARDFVEVLQTVGLIGLGKEKKFFDIPKKMCLEDQGSKITLEPSDALELSYKLDYPHPMLQSEVVFKITPDVYMREIAPSRTFCLKAEAEALKAAGLGRGANTENTLVMDDDGPVGNVLRFPDECARHKLSDLLGDLYVLGRPVRGRICAVKTGHRMNTRCVKELWRMI